MVVFGDSHAQMWMGAIVNMATQDGWAVIPLIKSSCTIRMWGGDTAAPGCASWFSWAVREDRSLHPNLTLISGVYQSTTGVPAFLVFVTKGLKAVIHTFRQTGQKVVVMGDVFGQTQQPVDCLLTAHPTMGKCSSPYDVGPITTNNVIHALASTAGAGFINSEGWFCALDQCPMVIGHTVAYFDESHVTKTYASELSTPLHDAFLAAVTAAKSG
jgi:hypothetical protein